MAQQLEIRTGQHIFRYRNFTILKDQILGHGSYGAVYRTKCDQLICAAKVLHPTIADPLDPGSDKILQRFRQECDFLNRIRHPHIVQYLGVCRDPDSNLPALLMELLDGSLTKMLECSQHPISYHIQVDLCHHVALAIAYLHTIGIIHRDLSGNNVLVIAGRRAKVTDFGMSRIVGVNHRFTAYTFCPGTLGYMSPESLKEPPRYTEKLDVFSQGVIMIQVCTRQFPDPGPSMKEVEDPRYPLGMIQVLVPESERRKKHIDLIDPAHPLLPFALACLEYRERDRPSAEELCQRLTDLKENQKYIESYQRMTLATPEAIHTLQQDRDELARQVDEKTQELTTKEQQMAMKDLEITVKEGEIAGKTQDLAIKNQQIAAKNREIHSLGMQLQELNQRLVNNEQVIAELQQTNRKLHRQIKDSIPSDEKQTSGENFTGKKVELHKAKKPWVRFATRCTDNDLSTQELYRKGGRKKKKRISHQPAFMTEEVELLKAEKPWVRLAAASVTTADDAETNTQELYRKFQGILNKLTPQKFQILAEQALDLEIDSEEKLMGCVDKIFTNVWMCPKYGIAYANLSKVLSPIKVDRVMPDGKAKSTNFRRVLLTKCQQEFEKDKKDDEETEKMLKAIEAAETPEAKKQLQDYLEVAQTQSRRRSLGNIQFIGELFKLKILSETTMHSCIVRLLRSSSDEESLECFARLISITGKDLDHPQAKTCIDNYFNRIADIIKKGETPVRIKFMLQDVQELRNNSWTPRTRQDHQLKTIDQIRADAELEAAKELEMVQKHMISKPTGGAGGRRGSKQDDWQTKGDRRDKENHREKETFDSKRILALSRRKETGTPALGPQTAPLHPGASGWGNRGAAGAGTTGSSAQDKDKKPSRSSSSGSKRNEKDRDKAPGRSSTSGPKRSFHSTTTPDSLKEQQAAALQMVKQMTSSKPPSSATTQAATPTSVPAVQVQVKAVEKKPPSPPLVDTLDEETLQRKAHTIIDELVANKDFREAVECVKELRSPGLMNVFVAESINHSLEKSQQARQCAGELFKRLIREQLLSEEKFVTGLNDVLEYAEDIEVDVPRIWQYLGGILSNVMATSVIPLSVFSKVPLQLVESGKASKLVAQTLVKCRDKVKDEAELVALWKQSQLQWTALGVNSEDLGEFLSRQGLEFLQETKKQSSQEGPYLAPLTTLIRAIDTSNDEIHEWIQKNCADIVETSEFVYNLTTAVFQAVVTGSGTSAIFTDTAFNKRAVVIKNHVKDSKELQMSVLYALQIAVTRLEHPPRLLNNIFNHLYDLGVIGEEAFVQWRDRGTEAYGKRNAVISVKTFFEWLAATETESEEEERDSGTS